MSNSKMQAAGTKKAMSKWMCWHKIPLRDEVERSNRLKTMPPDQCFKEFFAQEVEKRAWEKEFLAIFGACLQGNRNERRRDELLRHFICPFPNRSADGTHHGYVIGRDGYTPRAMVLMHVVIGLAYAGEVSGHVPSTAATAFYRQYREWMKNLFPDYRVEHDEDLGREDTMGGGFYYYGTEGDGDNLRWDPEYFVFNDGFVNSDGVQQYLKKVGVLCNDPEEGGPKQFKWEEDVNVLTFWRELMVAAACPPHDIWNV